MSFDVETVPPIPYNHDVRMSAIADGASTSVIGGMAGLFARVDRDA